MSCMGSTKKNFMIETKTTHIEQLTADLQTGISNAYETLVELEGRLNPILTPPTPLQEKPCSDVPGGSDAHSPLAESIYLAGLRVDVLHEKALGIIHRLEL